MGINADKTRVIGLLELRKVPIIHCFSGSWTQFAKDLMRALADVGKKQFHEKNFPSVTEILSKKAKATQINFFLFTVRKELEASIKREIVNSKREQPILIFNNFFKNEEFKKFLLTFLSPKELDIVDNDAFAHQLRKTSEARTKGVMWCYDKYHRGYDCQLAKDAYVLIIDDGKSSMLKVEQMIGRGCRSFGRATGAYFTTSHSKESKVNIMKVLEDNNRDQHECGQMIHKMWEHIVKGNFKPDEVGSVFDMV